MNSENLQQIFCHYIDAFEQLTNNEHHEQFKWIAAKEFRMLMDDALSKSGNEFVEALKKAKYCTKTIIDSFTQPFGGLVDMASCEPDTVKQMFVDLYSDDGGDLSKQEQLIENFFKQSEALLERHYPGSYRYKQNSHSVSAYLFLYAPDTHYMYKATQSCIFADCIEYYEDWGSGDFINLAKYYKMCDWVAEQINKSEALLHTNASRYELPEGNKMHLDENKHLLVFDLIYCCSVYDLFDGISFTRPKAKEKNIIIEKKNKALAVLNEYNQALDEQTRLNESMSTLSEILVPSIAVSHKMFGKGQILSYNNGILEIQFAGSIGVKKLGLVAVMKMGLIRFDDDSILNRIQDLTYLLSSKDSIESKVKRLSKEMDEYQEYLD